MRTGGFGRSADVNIGRVIVPLNLWDERDESAGEIADRLRQRTQDISGARVNANQVGSPINAQQHAAAGHRAWAAANTKKSCSGATRSCSGSPPRIRASSTSSPTTSSASRA